MPAGTRGRAVLAMTAAALAELAPGRVALGIGSSSPLVVRDWNRGDAGPPLERVRSTVEFLRAVLGGARVDGFRLAQPPRVAPGLLVGALGPAMVELAATVADGVILTCLSPDDARSVVERYRGCGGSRVVASVPVCPSADADAVRDAIRPSLSMYLGIRAYANFHRSMGRAELLAPMFDSWARGDREAAVRALPDEVVDDLVVHGTPDVCRRRLAEYGRGASPTSWCGSSPRSVIRSPRCGSSRREPRLPGRDRDLPRRDPDVARPVPARRLGRGRTPGGGRVGRILRGVGRTDPRRGLGGADLAGGVRRTRAVAHPSCGVARRNSRVRARRSNRRSAARSSSDRPSCTGATTQQKQRYLLPIARGEEIWAQGFSEPGAGSDLAALRTTARVEGDELVLHGHKIWTSQAQEADFLFLLARTDPDAAPHRGISYLLRPGASAGHRDPQHRAARRHRRVRRGAARRRARCPVTGVLGGLNNGWQVAMSTLQFERGTSATSSWYRYDRDVAKIVALTVARGMDSDPIVRQRIAGRVEQGPDHAIPGAAGTDGRTPPGRGLGDARARGVHQAVLDRVPTGARPTSRST